MLKKILKIFFAVVATGYALFAFAIVPNLGNEGKCKGILVEITGNSLDAISRKDIIDILVGEELDPSGKPMEEVLCRDIENLINNISLVKECQVYKSTGDYVMIEICCRKPIMKIFDKNGEAYCIDKEGNIIYGIQNALFLPVASGFIDKEIAGKEIKDIAVAIDKSNFWKAQIEQLYFNEKKEAILVPRVGNHTIELGTADNIEAKLDKLRTFYKQAINGIGWNKYSKINIEFADKVICTKREKQK